MDIENEATTPEVQQQAPTGFWKGPIGSSLRTQSATWFVGAVIAIMSVFSSKLTENLKFALNKADLRTKSYEDLARDLSEYVYISGLYEEFLENGWTSEKDLTPIISEYNEAITKLNRNEFVYISWLSRYWSKSDITKFAEIMVTVRSLDRNVHSMNSEAEQVVAHTKPKMDQTLATKTVEQMKPTQNKLRDQVSSMLEASM